MYAVLDPDDVGLMGSIMKVQAVHASDRIFPNSMLNVVCLKCHKREHIAKQCRSIVGHPMHPVVCYNCEEEGHIRLNCPYEMRAVAQGRKPFGPKILK